MSANGTKSPVSVTGAYGDELKRLPNKLTITQFWQVMLDDKLNKSHIYHESVR